MVRVGALVIILFSIGTARAAPLPRLPRHFLLGVATSGYQSEGGETDTNWSVWQATYPGTVEPIGRAIDFWHRYPADMARAARMGLNAFRLGIEWGRIEPTPGHIDRAAIAHYRTMIRTLRRHHLEPIVTLNHTTWPEWLEDQAHAAGAPSAWEYPPTAAAFVHYVQTVVRALGGDVHWYLTFNEPNSFLPSSYIFGDNPPGITGDEVAASGERNFYRALCTVLAAHAATYDAIHALDPHAKVSSNVSLLAFNGSLAPLQDADALPDYANNEFFFDWLSGIVRSFKIGESCAALYADQPVPAAAIAAGRKQDFLSFDYYYSISNGADLTNSEPAWVQPIYPPGLLDALRSYHARYPDLPIMIPENGIGTENGMPRADGWTREAVLVQHLAQVQAALAEGIPVIGYLHWSLTDNYEWGSYTPRFGLYTVDARTDPNLVRRATPAVAVYREIARHRGVTSELLARYPGP
jgi:beta-glucosidase